MGQYQDEAGAVGLKADGEIAAQDKIISTQQKTIDLQASTIQTQAGQIESLNRALAECQGSTPVPPEPPLPGPTKTYIGATLGSNDGGLNLKADARHGYDLTDNGAREAISRAADNGVIWVSYKGTITEAALRSELLELSNMLKPKNLTGMVTYEHEPDIKGGIPLPVYHAGYDQLEKVIVDFPTLEPIVCLTGFTGDKDHSIWEKYSRPTHKKIGFDHYNKGHQNVGEKMLTPEENFGLMVAWCKTKGKPMCLGETGVGADAVAGPTIKTQVQWYTAHRNYCLDPDNNIVVACAYDAGLSVLTPATARAWYGV